MLIEIVEITDTYYRVKLESLFNGDSVKFSFETFEDAIIERNLYPRSCDKFRKGEQ
jgi:hypothetical protein